MMTHSENVEKTRQAIMRMRELLDLMREQLEEGERDYAALFASLNPDDLHDLKEKEIQRLVALELVEDTTVLGDAALKMRFSARSLERDFEQVYDNLQSE